MHFSHPWRQRPRLIAPGKESHKINEKGWKVWVSEWWEEPFLFYSKPQRGESIKKNRESYISVTSGGWQFILDLPFVCYFHSPSQQHSEVSRMAEENTAT